MLYHNTVKIRFWQRTCDATQTWYESGKKERSVGFQFVEGEGGVVWATLFLWLPYSVGCCLYCVVCKCGLVLQDILEYLTLPDTTECCRTQLAHGCWFMVS